MRQAGRYMEEYRKLRSRVPFLELCRNPELCARVAVEARERLGADAAILFSDILLLAEALGLQLSYPRGEGPRLSPRVGSGADVDRLREVDPDELGFVYEAVRLTRQALPPRIPLIGFAGAPFTLAAYLIEGKASRDFARAKAFMYRDPGAWRALMEKLARATSACLRRQVEAGAQAVQLFDSWVGCLSPEDYRKYALPYSRAVLESLPEGVPRIHFGRGTGLLLECLKEAGGTVVGVDYATPLAQARRRLGNTPVQGNLDPAVLLADRRFLRRQARRVLRQGGGAGHIFNLGHGVLPQTPVENAVYLVEVVHEMSWNGEGRTGSHAEAR